MKYEDIKTPEDLYIFMRNNFRYGYLSNIDSDKHIREEMNNDELYEKILFNNFYLQTPKELLKSKCGICYDQVEFERKWFSDHNYSTKTFYTPYKNHAFLIYKDDDKYKLFERTVKEFNGIHIGNSVEELLERYKEKQLKDVDLDDIDFYSYNKATFGKDFNTLIKNIVKDNNISEKIIKCVHDKVPFYSK